MYFENVLRPYKMSTGKLTFPSFCFENKKCTVFYFFDKIKLTVWVL